MFRQLAPKLKDVNQRVLLVVGSGDLLLPSGDEGKRLEKVLPRCRLKVCPSAPCQLSFYKRMHSLFQSILVMKWSSVLVQYHFQRIMTRNLHQLPTLIACSNREFRRDMPVVRSPCCIPACLYARSTYMGHCPV